MWWGHHVVSSIWEGIKVNWTVTFLTNHKELWNMLTLWILFPQLRPFYIIFFQPVWFGPSGAPVPQDFRCSFLLLVVFLNKALQAFYFLNDSWFLCWESETFLETFLPDADMSLSHCFFVNRQILQTNFECVLVYCLWAAFLKFKKRFVKVLFQTNFMILMFHSILQLQK